MLPYRRLLLLSGESRLEMTDKNRLVAPGADQERGATAARPLRILVAEDDRDAALTLVMLLRSEGHDAQAVHASRNVMGSVLDFDPDVVILDIHMPGQSGWEIARDIRARRGRQRPVLIGVSGEYTKSVDQILSSVIGFKRYYVKPYDPNELLRFVGSYRTLDFSENA